MDTFVQKFIEMCAWDHTQFFIISHNVFDPLIYYSHLLPLGISLLLALFIFYQDRASRSAQWLLVTTMLLSCWLYADLIVWATNQPAYTVFFWSVINMIEPFIYIGMLFFAYAMIDDQDLSFRSKSIIFFLSLPLILLMPTRLAIYGFDLSNCNREAIEGPLVYYGYALEIFFLGWIFWFGVKKFFHTEEKIQRKKIALTLLGIVFFLASFAMGNILGSFFVDWTIGQYGLFGIPVFIGILGYLIVRYQAFHIKLVAAEALVWTIGILVGAQFFFIRTTTNRVLNTITFIGVLIGGYILVKSVNEEVRQKEKIANMANDISRAFETERRANEELQELDKVKNQFLTTTQHDLRTPLTAIGGYIELLLDGTFGKQTKKTVEVLKKIQVVAQGMKRKADSFLDTAQFKLGKSFMVLKPKILLNTIIQEIITELLFKAETNKTTLRFASSDKQYFLAADREKLKGAIMNIIDNAIKYAPGGEVVVSFSQKLGEASPWVYLMIKDNGIGIAPDKLSSILSHQFERSEEARKTAEGKGVGLYLAAQIIKYHNGRIWVESDGLGKGSVFHIELPLDTPVSPVTVPSQL